jgi:thioredoxin-dependent peroxiredoxin
LAKITLHGNPVETSGSLPAKGTTAPKFTLLRADLSSATLETFSGKRKVVNIFPSIDTPTCSLSVRQFNQRAAELSNTVVLCVSADLPFAQKRFCGAEGIKNCETLSTFRSSFSKDWGLEIATGPLAGLCSRAVVVLDESNRVVYTEQVADIANEPNYDQAIASLQGA